MAKIDTFDKTDLFKKNIEPKLEELENLCTIYGIPFFWTACVKSEEENTEYKNMGFMTGSHGIRLYDDKIKSCLKIMRGFVPQVPNMEINMGDIEGRVPTTLPEDGEAEEEEEE